jgi:hypothetical protein
MSQAMAITQDAAVMPVVPAAVALGTLQATSAVALVQGAREMADALADVIERQKLATTIQGRRYVKVEGWTTLGVMLGVVPREVSTMEQDGIYTATVELVRIGDQGVISRASAECGSPDELDRYGNPVWANRPRYARRSMAQTRATGKACRLAFSWIMALAGYEPTPVEEMPDTRPPRDEYEKRDNDKICLQSKEHRQIEVKLRELQLDRERVRDWCKKKWGIEHFSDLTLRQYRELLSRFTHFAEQMAKEMETAEAEAQAEREAIQAESQPEVSEEAKKRADELMERARSIRTAAAHADRGQDYHRETQEAETLEREARALLAGK